MHRMFEGGDVLGLDQQYSLNLKISDRIAESRKWATQALQPNYIHLSMNSAISGNWRVGRWQNLVSKGEMMRAMTDFRRMRFGLGVTLMTDSYFAMDIGQPARIHANARGPHTNTPCLPRNAPSDLICEGGGHADT